jgi:uncharacterized protein
VSDARHPASEPSDDPHLPDPDAEAPVDPPTPEWVPVASEAAELPVEPPSPAWVPEPVGSESSEGARSRPPSAVPSQRAATRAPTTPGSPGAAVATSTASGAPGAGPSNVPTAAAMAEAPGLDDRERPLAPKVVTAWRIGSLVSLILPTMVLSTLGFVFLDAWGWAILGTLVALALFLTVWYAPARYKRWRWQLTDLAVELRFGVLVRQQETVPYFRIQQIDIVQGPLDRVLDLASLQVTTASASGSASLPGIANDDAPTVRAELLARAAAAVADHPGDLRDAV